MNTTPSDGKKREVIANNTIGEQTSAKVRNSGWLPNREQMRDPGYFSVVCKNCKQIIVKGKCAKDGDPHFHFWDISYFYRVDKDKKGDLVWVGLLEANIDPKSHELRCACCCGNHWKVEAGLIDGDKYKGFDFKVT